MQFRLLRNGFPWNPSRALTPPPPFSADQASTPGSAPVTKEAYMELRRVTVLLVERDARCTSALESYLLKRGCELCLATSKKEALEFLDRRHFDLVLSEFLLSDGTAYELMLQLLGSSTTMFFFNAVEDGCWWMNAIYEGQDRSQDPGMRPAQFKILLDKILLTSYRSKSQNQECTVQSATFEVQASIKKRRSPMRRTNDGPVLWSPTQLRPGIVASFRRWNTVIISVLVFFVLGVFVAAIGPGLEGRATAASKVPLKIDKDPSPVSLADFKNGYAPVIDPALPAVVNISSTKVVKQQNNFPSMFNDPFFRQFFGDQFNPSDVPQTDREYSLGSGVIVNPDGYILTNDHVISGASDIEVYTQDKKKFKAKLIGTDSLTDIAVLKIDETGLPALTLGDSSRLKVGDVVFAIGDPFGIGETATMGIVSATGRGLGGSIEHYENFIQTDAAINPGNSGGALLDLHGDLVGINTAIITGNGSGGNQGVGLAIPINMAHNVMEQIVDHGKVIRGHLGIAIQSVDADMAKAFGLTHGGGALVSEVTPGSPAAKAGIDRGDIILALNGQPVSGPDDLSVNISQTSPGTTVHIKIARNGQTRDVSVTLTELAEKQPNAVTATPKNSALEGVQVENLTPATARQLGVAPSLAGVVVTSVDPSSAAAAADLESGDIIQEVNRKSVHNIDEYNRATAALGNQPALLLVNRGGNAHFVVVEPQPPN